jgi:hypothetical protein
MITITVDLFSRNTPDTALIGKTPSDYVHLRQQIRKALNNNTSLNIYILSPVLERWLHDLKAYPSSVICWKNIDPNNIFYDLFGQYPYGIFTKELISELNLTRFSNLDTKEVTDPFQWIVSKYLDKLWHYEMPPTNHVETIIEWFQENSKSLNRIETLLIEEQLRRWSDYSSFYMKAPEISISDHFLFIAYRTLFQTYSLTWIQEQKWANYISLPQALPNKLALTLEQNCDSLLQKYWNTFISEHSINDDIIRSAVQQMTGYYQSELNALKIMLEKSPNSCTKSLQLACQKIFQKNYSLHLELSSIFSSASPDTPSKPNLAWDYNTMIKWAINEYMPYYNWVINTNNKPDLLFEHSLIYSDWLLSNYQNFTNIKSPDQPLITKQHQRVKQVLNNKDNVVLWLIFNTLTINQANMLINICSKHNINIVENDVAITLIPSNNKSAEYALFTGSYFIQHSTSNNSIDLSLSHLNDVRALSHYDISSLKQILSSNPLDCLIITNNTEKISDNNLHEIYNNISEFITEVKSIGKEPHIFIASKHGCTELVDHFSTINDHPFMRNVQDTIEYDDISSELINIPRLMYSETSNYIPSKEDWFILDHKKFGLPQDYFVPKKYNFPPSISNSNTVFYGGLSPEETLVPLIHLSTQQVEVSELKFIMEDSIRHGILQKITIKIINSNQVPVTDINLKINDQVYNDVISKIPELSNEEVIIQLQPIYQDGPTAYLDILLEYKVMGSLYTQKLSKTVSLRRLQTSSIDDLFN